MQKLEVMCVILQQRPQHITKLIYCSRTVPELEKVFKLLVFPITFGTYCVFGMGKVIHFKFVTEFDRRISN